jgi:hypothetical protein
MPRIRQWRSLLAFFVLLLTSASCPAAHAEDQSVTVNTPEQASAGRSTGTPAISPRPDDRWHIGLLVYLWFPGAHGTLGTSDRNAEFRASPGDLLSHFRFGLMGAVQAQRAAVRSRGSIPRMVGYGVGEHKNECQLA